MKARRSMALVLAAGLALTLAGCPKDGGTGRHSGGGYDFSDPKPRETRPLSDDSFDEPNPGQQPPPPVADPGPYNEPGHARFQVIWTGERGGKVEYTIGGAGQPLPCPRPTKDRDGKYRGACYKDVSTIKGNTIGFTWFPDAPGMFAQCTLYANGQIQDYQHVQGGSCAVSWLVV